MNKNCGICLWIATVKSSPFLIKELTTGYAVISKFQYYKGYTLFLSKEHVFELHELESEKRSLFLEEMSKVAEAVYKSTKPDKLNYELLGNGEPHLHWHIIPRYKTDPQFKKPIWMIDKKIRESVNTYPSVEEIYQLKEKIVNNL